jgi:hypothetical protein
MVVHLCALHCVARNAGQVRSALNDDIHGRKRSATLLIVIVADHVGQVLDEIASLVHVEHLRATADAEERQVCCDGGCEQVVFELVSIPSGLIRRLVRGLSVARRVNIFAAGNQQAIEARHDVTG